MRCRTEYSVPEDGTIKHMARASRDVLQGSLTSQHGDSDSLHNCLIAFCDYFL